MVYFEKINKRVNNKLLLLLCWGWGKEEEQCENGEECEQWDSG